MSSTPAKTKKVAKAKKPAAHPKYVDMVKQAIASLKERGGSSRQAISKYIMANFKVEKNASANNHLKTALKKGVESGALKRVKGVGAAGSFKLGGEEKVKKPKAKKPKAAKAAKKATGEKKPKAKKPKTPKKKAAAKPKKSPAKKAAKPKKSPAKKAAKKVKSPKRPAKKAAKK